MTLERIDRVTVENWRNWQDTTTVDGFEQGLVVLSGPNAVGKTGLWEAIVLGLLDRHWGTHTDRLRPAGTKRVIPRVEIEFVAGGSRYRVEKHFGGAAFRDRANFWEWKAGTWALKDQGEEAYFLCRKTVLGTDVEAPSRGGVDRALKDTLMEVLLPPQGALTSEASTPEAISLAVTDQAAATSATRLGRVLDLVTRAANDVWVGQRDRSRKGSALQVGEERLDQIAEEITPLQDKVDRIGELVGGLASATEELAGMGEAAERLAEAEDLSRDADAHRKEREAAKEAWDDVHQRAQDAKALQDDRTALVGEVGDTAGALERALGEIEKREAARKLVDADRDAESKRRTALAGEVQRHRDWIAYETREAELEHLRGALAGVTGRLETIDEQEECLRAAEAEKTALPLPTDEEWTEIEEAQRDLHEARGRLAAGAWSVDGRVPEGIGLRVDGEEVETEEVALEASREVEITGGEGRSLCMKAPVGEAGEVERLASEIEAVLRRFDVDDVAGLRKRAAHVTGTLDQRIATAEELIERALDTGTKTDLLKEQVRLEGEIRKKEAMEAPTSERPAGSTEEWKVRLEFLGGELEAAQTRVEDAKGRSGEAMTSVEEGQQAVEKAEREAESTRTLLDAHREEHGPDDDLRDRAVQARAESDRTEEAWKRLDDARAMAENVKEERAQKLRKGLTETLAKQADVQRLEAGIEALRREDPEGRLAILEAERAALEPRVRAERTQADALRLLEEALKEERKRVTEAVGEPVRERIQRWVSYLLQDDSEVVVDEDGTPSVIRTPAGQEVPYPDQSFGTREQVSILYRLAVADLVAGEAGTGVCLMLDDPFGHTDRGRRARMLEILAAEADRRGHQILVFTCRPEDFEGVGVHVPVAGVGAD